MKNKISDILSALRARVGDLWWYSLMMSIVGLFVSVLNLIVGAFLVPAKVPLHDMGAIAPFQSMMITVFSVANIVAYLGLKYTSRFHVEEKPGHIKSLFRHILLVTFLISVVAVVFLLLFRVPIQLRFKFADSRVVIAVAGCLFLAPFIPVLKSMARGVMAFGGVVISNILLSVTRLILILLLLERGGLLGYWTATFGSSFVLVLFLFWLLRGYLKPSLTATSYKEHRLEMGGFLRSGGLVPVIIGISILVESVAIRNFTSIEDSAGYYMAMVFGSIPLFLSCAITPFLLPMITQRQHKGEDGGSLLLQSVSVIMILGTVLVIGFGLSGNWLLNLREVWRIHASYSPLIWKIGVVSVLQGVITAFSEHENACNKFKYVKVYITIYLLDMICVYSFLGWGAFQGILPAGIWQYFNELFSARLNLAVLIMMLSRGLLAMYVFWRIWQDRQIKTG